MAGVCTLTVNVRVTTSPAAVATASSISRRDSALTVVAAADSRPPRCTATW